MFQKTEQRFDQVLALILKTGLTAAGTELPYLPKVTKLLRKNQGKASQMRRLAKKQKFKWRSLVDFLLCWKFVEYRESCLSYYQDEENPDLWGIAQKEQVDLELLDMALTEHLKGLSFWRLLGTKEVADFME